MNRVVVGPLVCALSCALFACNPEPPDSDAPAPPTLDSITSPTIAATQVVTGSKASGSHIYINGVQVTADDAYDAGTWSATLSLIEGENPLFVTAKDEFLNESSGTTAAIVRERPVISAPTPEVTLGNLLDVDPATADLDIDVVVNYGTQDVAIGDVELLESASPVCGTATATARGATFRCTLTNGSHTLSARIVDSAGNEAVSDDTTLTVNATPLTVSITGPTTTGNQNEDFTVTVSGAPDGQTVDFYVNGVLTDTQPVSAEDADFTNIDTNTGPFGDNTLYEARTNNGTNAGTAFHITRFN